jgi:hypothetical protein
MVFSVLFLFVTFLWAAEEVGQVWARVVFAYRKHLVELEEKENVK